MKEAAEILAGKTEAADDNSDETEVVEILAGETEAADELNGFNNNIISYNLYRSGREPRIRPFPFRSFIQNQSTPFLPLLQLEILHSQSKKIWRKMAFPLLQC